MQKVKNGERFEEAKVKNWERFEEVKVKNGKRFKEAKVKNWKRFKEAAKVGREKKKKNELGSLGINPSSGFMFTLYFLSVHHLIINSLTNVNCMVHMKTCFIFFGSRDDRLCLIKASLSIYFLFAPCPSFHSL